MRYLIIFALVISSAYGEEKPNRIPKTEKVLQTIEFDDDLNFENLKLAITRQLKALNNRTTKFKLGDDEYSRNDIKETLELFDKQVDKAISCLELMDRKTCIDELSLVLNTEYSIYKPVPDANEAGFKTGQTLFTAYYSPDLHGSLTQDEVYKYPIYTEPKEASLKSLTREEIDFENKLAGKGLELFYVKESRYDIWLLHVEGGGRVQIKNADGTVEKHFLSYQSTNKQSFNMLYKYMLKEGMLKPGEASIENQRKYLEENPQDERRVLSSCPSYIYFKVTDDEPLGVKNMPLTENRSLATDYRRYKEYGLLNFIQAKKPVKIDGKIEMTRFSRFFLNQDTGGAIKGNARSDLYFGFGLEAEMAANHIKNLGNQYFLIKK